MKMKYLSMDELRDLSRRSFTFECRRRPFKFLAKSFGPDDVNTAAAFLEAITEGKAYRWMSSRAIQVPHLDAEIQCDNLEQVVEDGDASQAELHPSTIRLIDYFLHRASSREVVEATRGASARRDDVPLDKLAREFGIKPNAARRILRGAGMKPAGSRWAWSETGADEARQALRKALKVS